MAGEEKQRETVKSSPDLFVQLFLQHERRLFGYIFSLMQNREDAEDVFQETSTLLWEKFNEFEIGTSFMAWSCKVAYFKVLEHRKKKKRQKVIFSDALMEVLTNEIIEMEDDLQEQSQMLEQCVQELPAEDRLLIRYRYAPHGTTKATAEKVHRSVPTVRKELRRIHRMLLLCVNRRMGLSPGPVNV